MKTAHFYPGFYLSRKGKTKQSLYFDPLRLETMSNIETHTEFSHWEKQLHSDPHCLTVNNASGFAMLEQESNFKCRKQICDIYS